MQITSKPPKNAIGGATKTTVKVKLLNQGTGTLSGNTSVTLYLSADDVVDGNDTLLKTFDLPGLTLKKRQSRALSQSLTLPAPAVDGSYRFIAVADPGGGVAESDEGNNTAVTSPFALAHPFYNLTATARPVTIRSGKAGTISLTVRNTGNADVTAVQVPFRAIFSSDGIFDDSGETTLLNLTLPVSAKAKKTKAVKLPVPAGVALPVGKFSIRVLIDPDQVTADADRTDNTVTVPVTVR